ncbi:hypothetical protein DEU56DRAFT_772041 [Suillus clintonianus]|uniref:uncharacterized protein n=1 Tax=Suillus clintonianus TaxID=1904413 RepID=UPI001B8748B8|nr:uncharacterized protein DEU56DRAFT_772041 [Suillus clintonianus]KAG2153965.1 hypothetical protein DEU56DRAFT_772041 [Suillus clintonianus]
MKSVLIAAIALCASWAYAQTETITDINGATVVEVVTVNPLGLPTTQILSTITGVTTPLTSNTLLTTTTTTNPILQTIATTSTTKNQGPVEQPASTVLTPGGPTPYTYTTTNAAGSTVAVLATFTPSGPVTVLPTPTTTGTIVNYSSYLASVGTSSAATSGASRRTFSLSSAWYGLVVSTVLGIGGGAWFVML